MNSLFPLKWRCTVPARGAAPPSSGNPSEQQAIDAQHAAFDAQQAEHAELLRELDALESLMLEQLKNEDEILKKWIGMV